MNSNLQIFKIHFKSSLLFILICLISCNKTSTENKLRNYQIKAVPDSVIFGQNKAVVLAIKNLKAKDVWNKPENDTSIELSYNLEVTNNNPINGEHVFINPSNFRLVLDNHHKLTHAFYNSLGADPQSTTVSTGNIFNLPAKTKPVALDFFLQILLQQSNYYLNNLYKLYCYLYAFSVLDKLKTKKVSNFNKHLKIKFICMKEI